jgi:hypothetical protein
LIFSAHSFVLGREKPEASAKYRRPVGSSSLEEIRPGYVANDLQQ